MSKHEKYKKLNEAIGTEGQDYEISVLTLVYVWCMNHRLHFRLATSLESARPFDDVVLLLENCEDAECNNADCPKNTSALLLLQLTHKRNYRPTRLTMMSNGKTKEKLSVKQCFESYTKVNLKQIKADLVKADKDLNVLFGLCTNSLLDGQVFGSSQKIIPNDLFLQLGTSEAFAIDDTDLTSEKEKLAWMESQKAKKFLESFRFFHGRSTDDFDKRATDQLEQIFGPDARPLFSVVKQRVREWWHRRETEVEYLSWSYGPMNEICARILDDTCDHYLRECSASWVDFSEECIAKFSKHFKRCNKQITFFTDEGASALTAIKVHQTLSVRELDVIGSVRTLEEHEVTVARLLQRVGAWLVVVEEAGQDARPLLARLGGRAVLVAERRVQGAVVDSCVAADLAPSTLDRLPRLEVRLQGDQYPAALGDLLPDGASLVEVLEGHGRRLMRLVSAAVRREPLRLGRPLPPVDDWYVRRRLVSNRQLDGDSFLRSLGKSDICLTDDASAERIRRILPHCHPLRYHDAAYVITEWPLIFIGDNSRAVSQKFAGCNVYNVVHTPSGWELLSSTAGISSIRNYLVYEEKVDLAEETRRKVLLSFSDLTERVVIISGKPGVGKSSLLGSIAQEIKEKDPKTWVLRFNLVTYANLLKQSQNTTEAISEMLKDALLSALLEIQQSHLELAILQQCLKHAKNVVILVDGFDEISPDYTDKCLAILQSLISQCRLLCVATRPTMAKELEDVLGVVAFTLEEYSDQELQKFFLNYKNSGFIKELLSVTELNEQLINILRIPLFAKVFADIVARGGQKAHDPVTLFEEFFEMKYQRMFEEKYSVKLSVPGAIRNVEIIRADYMNELMQLALISLLSEGTTDLKLPVFKGKLNNILKPGIVFDFVNEKPIFLHRTYAEFFLAKWCIRNVDNCTEVFRVSFLDHKLEFFVECFSRMACRGKVLHEAVINNNKDTVTEFLSSSDTIRAETDVAGRNALHLAVIHGRWKIARLLVGTGARQLMVKDSVLGWTPLEYAQAARRWGIIGILLQAGVPSEDLAQGAVDFGKHDASQLETIFRTSGYPALLDAILGGDTSTAPETQYKVAVSLIIAQFPSGCRGPNGRTLVQCALEHDHREVAATLVMGRADALAPDSRGRTALDTAAERGAAGACALLLELAVDTPAAALDWGRLLAAAAAGPHLRVVECLAAAKLQGRRHSGWTYLHWAAASEDTQVLKALLDAGAEVDAQDTEGSTALHVAAARNKVEAVRLLLQGGCNTDMEDYRGDTPLALAAREKYMQVLETLAAAKLRGPRNEDWTCVQWAAACGDAKTLGALVSAGGDALAPDAAGRSPLHLAALGGHGEASRLLLDRGASPRLQDRQGRTALALACEAGHQQVIEYLAEAALDDSPDLGFGYLHIAAEAGDTQVLGDLLRGCPDVAARSDCLCTPLHTAAASGQLECAVLLLEAGAGLEDRDEEGLTPLLMAAAFGEHKVLRELLARGANAAACDDAGRTALELAAEGNHTESARALLEAAGSAGGGAALLAAAAAGGCDVLLELCKGGCDMTARDAEGSTALHISIAKGHLDCAKVLLEQGANPDEKDARGLTAIVVAVKLCQPHVLKELLRCLFDIRGQQWSRFHWAAYLGDDKWAESLQAEEREARAPGGLSALHVAAAAGQPRVARALLARGCAVDGADACGWTPLQYAAACAAAGRRLDTVRALLEAGADAAYQAPTGDSVLSLASAAAAVEKEKFSWEVVSALAAKLLLYECQTGWTILHWAVHSRNAQVIRALIDSGHNVSPKDERGSIALHLAAEEGYVEGARILLDAGAKIDKKDKSGHTALVLAAERGLGEMMLFLRDAGADTSALEAVGYTALHTAVLTGDVKQVKGLLKQGVDVNVKTTNGFTPIMVAACIRNLEMVMCLMGSNPDLAKTNFINWTALHYAARNGPAEVVKYLIDQGADINAPSKGNWKPIHLAARYSDVEVVDILLKAGADPEDPMNRVESPLRLAVVGGRPRTVRRLLDAGVKPGEECLLALATSDDCNDADDAARPEVARILLEAGVQAHPSVVEEARRRGFMPLAAALEQAVAR